MEINMYVNKNVNKKKNKTFKGLFIYVINDMS